MHVSSRVADKSAFKEGDIEDGGIKVDVSINKGNFKEHFRRRAGNKA